MPYIDRDKRAELDGAINALATILRKTNASEGELNYTLTMLVNRWVGDEAGYTDLNAALGVLVGVLFELYRKRGAMMEDAAMVRNGPLPIPGYGG